VLEEFAGHARLNAARHPQAVGRSGSMTSFRVFQPAVAASVMFAHALVAGSTNLPPVEINDTLHGHFVYMKNCVHCHGKRGDGKGEMGLTVIPLPRDFGAGVFKYRSTPSGFLPTNDDLARVVRE